MCAETKELEFVGVGSLLVVESERLVLVVFA